MEGTFKCPKPLCCSSTLSLQKEGHPRDRGNFSFPGCGESIPPTPREGPGGESFVFEKISIKAQFPQSLGHEAQFDSHSQAPLLLPQCRSLWFEDVMPPHASPAKPLGLQWSQVRVTPHLLPLLRDVTHPGWTPALPLRGYVCSSAGTTFTVVFTKVIEATLVTRGLLCKHRDLVIRHLSHLGLRVNWEKSKLMQTMQTISFLCIWIWTWSTRRRVS